MSTSLLLRRLHRPCSSHAVTLITLTPCASIYGLFSSATARSPPSNPHFTVEYLIQSVGLPSDKAIRASKKLQHLKSLDKPNAVLQFLRQTGISDSSVRNAVLQDPRFLCSSVEKNMRPNFAKLQEVGLSTENISGIISACPALFRFNIVPKIDFWMQALGSIENVSRVITMRPVLLTSSLEKVVMPNLSFLKEQCGLSVHRIFLLIKLAPRMIESTPESLEIKAKKAEQLGVARTKPMFMHMLAVVGSLNQSTLDAKLLYLKSFGLSQEEVTLMICKAPRVLMISEESICRKMEFLINEAGCEKLDVVRSPALLTYSLEKRLIPRSLVRKHLKSKGHPAVNYAFVSFMVPSEKCFVEKFILPYEHAIPGLHQAYVDACAGKIGGLLNRFRYCILDF